MLQTPALLSVFYFEIINYIRTVLSCADGRGLTEDEYSASVATLQSLVSSERISCVELRRWDCGSGVAGQYLLRTELDHNDFMEIRSEQTRPRLLYTDEANYKVILH